MTTVIPLPSGGYRVFVKGAAEILLAICVAREQPSGEVVPLSAADKVWNSDFRCCCYYSFNTELTVTRKTLFNPSFRTTLRMLCVLS